MQLVAMLAAGHAVKHDRFSWAPKSLLLQPCEYASSPANIGTHQGSFRVRNPMPRSIEFQILQERVDDFHDESAEPAIRPNISD